MFERFTETARRAIFFARYEASQYGSPYIETEHLLLGVARESRGMMSRVFGPTFKNDDVRREIEKFITRGTRIATSVEVPLSREGKEVLIFANEESKALGSHYVGPEHMLLGLLRVEKSLAARVLKGRGAELAAIRELVSVPASAQKVAVVPLVVEHAEARLHGFLARLGSSSREEIAPLLARNAELVDSNGARWMGRDEIEKHAKDIFAAYAPNSVTATVEGSGFGPGNIFVASLLWANAEVQSQPPKPLHRMTIALVREGEGWVVLFVQVTPVLTS
jgi:hypothetical protein